LNDDLESLRSFSAVNKRRVESVGDPDDADRFAENMPRFPPPTEVAPTAEELQLQPRVLPQGSKWMSFTTGSLHGSSSVVAAAHDEQTERLLSGLQRRSKISRLKMTNFPSLLAERSSRCQNSVKKFVLPRLCSCRSC
jgi:hypothetical protein